MVSLTGCMRVSIQFSLCYVTKLEIVKEIVSGNSYFLSSIISEEVFASNGAIWWSSTGKYLAYLELNDTEVQKVEFPWYGSEQYPETVILPYPKVGKVHSELIVNIYYYYNY